MKAADIRRGRHLREAIAITYLGQVGFLFEHDGLSVLIDPYLTYSGGAHPADQPAQWQRSYPPPVAADQSCHVDLVLGTHDHLDHTDPATLRGIAKASPEAVFAGPRKVADIMRAAGLAADKMRTLNAGAPFAFGALTVEPVAAAHEDYERDAEGYHTHLAYVLRWAGRTLFHAGDTTPQEQLSADVSHLAIDVAFLPINGRDAARRQQGIVGNMDSREAVAFAVRHRVGLLVPTHFDLYPNNGASLPEFVREAEAADPHLRFKAFRPGEQMLLPVQSD